MEVQDPWIHELVRPIVRGHHKKEKAHEDKIHPNNMKRKPLLKSTLVNHRKPRITGLLIRMGDDEEPPKGSGTN